MSIILDALKKAQMQRQKAPKSPEQASGNKAIPLKRLILLSAVGLVALVIIVLVFQKPGVPPPATVATKPQVRQPEVQPTPSAPVKETPKPSNPALQRKVAPSGVPDRVAETLKGGALGLADKSNSRAAYDGDRSEDTTATGKAGGQSPRTRVSTKVATETGSKLPPRAAVPSPGGLADDGAFAARRAGDSRMMAMYNEASEAYKLGQKEKAKTLYRAVLAERPNFLEALNNLGVISLGEGNFTEALYYFSRILEYDRRYPKAYNNIGIVQMREGELRKAEESLRRAIDLESDSVEPFINLAAVLLGQGRPADAAQVLQPLIARKVRSAPLYLSYAVTLDEMKNYDEAAKYYSRFLGEGSESPERGAVIDRLKYFDENRPRKDR